MQFPTTQKTYGLYNNIAGGADVTARLGASGNTLTISNGKYRLVSTDGTDWYDIFTLSGLGEAWIKKTSDYTASAGDNIFVDTNGGAVAITLPSSAAIGDQIKFIDAEGTFATHNLTVNRNGHKIQGSASNLTVSTSGSGFALVYNDSDNGWRLKYND